MKKSCLSPKKIDTTTLLFIVIALIFGLVFVREVPLFWNLDESAHFSRAYQVSEGDLVAHKLANGNYGGLVPASLVSLDTAVHTNLNELSFTPVINRHDTKNLALQKSIAHQKIDQKQKASFNFPGSAAYSPVAYVAPSSGILVCRMVNCSLVNTIKLARISSLILYVGIVAFSIWLLRRNKLRWLIFVLALLPVAVFQSASVSADGPVIALVILLFAILAKAMSEKKLSSPLAIILLLTAILIPLMKVNYGIFDLCLLPLTAILFQGSRRALAYTTAFLFIALVIASGWLYIARGPTKAISTLQASNPATHTFVSAKEQSRLMLRQPSTFPTAFVRTVVVDEPFWVYSTTGEFALNAVQMPLTAIVFAYMIIVSSALYAKDEIARYKTVAIILGSVSVLVALSIFVTLYLTFTTVGKTMIDGVQGRYFIPLLPFFLVAVAAVIPIKVVMSPKTAMILFSTSSSVLLLSGVIYYGLATY